MFLLNKNLTIKIFLIVLMMFSALLTSCYDSGSEEYFNDNAFIPEENSNSIDKFDDNNSFLTAEFISLEPETEIIPGYIWLTSTFEERMNSSYDEDFFTYQISKKIVLLKVRAESDNLKINQEDLDSLQVNLYKNDGSLIENHHSDNFTFSNLEPGTYFLKIFYDSDSFISEDLGNYSFKFEMWTDDSAD